MNKSTRRKFLVQSSLGAAGAMIGAPFAFGSSAQMNTTPAVLGGNPVRAAVDWIKWPVWNAETDEPLVLEAIRSGVWSRAKKADQFEAAWASMLGVKRCMSTVNGTNALIVALNQLGIAGGDEVLVPPYTFIATVQAILVNGAMPVFVDVDPHTYQMDPSKIEAKITSRTKAILPVHILGQPADMDKIMSIAKKRNLLVLEDACQAHLAEVNGKKVSTIGDAGCFSFQNSKNLAIGEGGAIVSNNDKFIDHCFSYHNLGFPYGSAPGSVSGGGVRIGGKTRITEYQAAIGLVQMKRLEEQTATRNKNADYLRSRLKNIPGIVSQKLYDNTTRSAYLLYSFRYKPELFKGLSRAAFVKALQAENIPCSTGYTPLNTQDFLGQAFTTTNFKKMYPKEMLDHKRYLEKNKCPQNDKLCSEAVWLTQNMLLGSATDMDAIANAIEKISKNADKIKSKIGD